VDRPHNGNNLSSDGGDKRTDGSDDNTVVNARPHDSRLPASPQYPQDLLPALEIIDDRLEYLLNIRMAIGYTIDRMGVVLDNASDNNDNCV
jgi:hypothetical protein